MPMLYTNPDTIIRNTEQFLRNPLKTLVAEAGLEPATFGL